MTPSRRRSTWAHPTRLDLTWQRHVDLSRLQTTWDVQKLWWTVLAWTLYVYPRLIIKCFIIIPSADIFLLSFFEGSSYSQLKLCFVTVLTRYSYSQIRRLWHFVVRPSPCCPAVCLSVTDVLWLLGQKLFTLIISPASINPRRAKFDLNNMEITSFTLGWFTQKPLRI